MVMLQVEEAEAQPPRKQKNDFAKFRMRGCGGDGMGGVEAVKWPAALPE